MNAKIVSILAICVAVIVAGVSGVVISMQRADAARAAADKAASEETIASKRVREAETERATAAAAAREAEAKAESEKASLAAAEAANEKLKLENENLVAKKALAADERAKAEIKAALDAGFSLLGFSDHAPYRDHPRDYAGIRMSPDLLPDYAAEFFDLKRGTR